MRARELVERTLGGDPEARRDVREGLAAGDADITREVGRRLAEGDSDLGKQLMAAEEDPVLEGPAAFQAALLDAKDRTTSRPGTTGRLLEELEARARRLGACQTVQVLGLDARRRTLVGDLLGAREALAQARNEMSDCRACDLDTMRREALLLLYLGKEEEALRLSQRAMDGYEAFGSPGHDLNGNGWASSLIVRAEIRCELEDYAGSAADCATALKHFPRASKVWQVTHQNMAATLALTGPAGRRDVSAELVSLRLTMRKGVSVERAAFLWLDGQLVVAIGDRRYRGLERLQTSLRLYGHPRIATPRSWLGVASDYARALFPESEAIARWLEREVAPHARRLIKDARDFEQLKDLYALAKRRHRSLSMFGELRRGIESLRECAGTAMPCLLPPWRDA